MYVSMYVCMYVCVYTYIIYIYVACKPKRTTQCVLKVFTDACKQEHMTKCAECWLFSNLCCKPLPGISGDVNVELVQIFYSCSTIQDTQISYSNWDKMQKQSTTELLVQYYIYIYNYIWQQISHYPFCINIQKYISFYPN